jgi:oligopeptidase B
MICGVTAPTPRTTSRPPEAVRKPVTSIRHGVEHVDPYAWISEPELPEVAALLAAERDYYDARTEQLRPGSAVLVAEMVGRVPPAERSAPWDQHGYRYWLEAAPGADHPALVRRPLAGDPGSEQVLLDVQAIDERAGTGYCQTGVLDVSPDGAWLAWSVDLAGDEVYAMRFRDLATGADLPEVISRTYYGSAWAADSRSLLYTVHDSAYRPYQVWRHVLGTDPVADVLVLQEDDERFEVVVDSSRTGAWAHLRLHARDTTEEYLVPASDLSAPPRLVRRREPGVEYALEHAPGHAPAGDEQTDGFLVVTNLGAAEFRLAWAPVAAPDRWSTVLPEDPRVRLHSVDAFAAGLAVSVRQDGVGVVRVFPRGGEPFDVRSDAPGGLARVGRNDDFAAGAVTVVLQTFAGAAVHVDVDLRTGDRADRHREQSVGVDEAAYVQDRLLVPRPDGVAVPVVLVRHRDTPLDGTAPCLLYGYGSYEVCTDPDFGLDWPRTLPSLLDRGVVFAVGQPRGGGEMGRRWWVDGHLLAKPNTFDDQCAVADLLADGIVDGTRIVTRGLSAGGLLQGALYGRRPKRWAGVLAEVPFVDVVTTMLDPSLPLTVTEWDEWGDPREPRAAAVMASYSPIENRPAVGVRPPLLVTGAVHDPRVLVREPARWVAALRHDDPDRGAGADPGSPVSAGTVLFRCETGAGAHAGPAGRFGQLHYEAEVLAWCLAALRVPVDGR